MELNINFLKNIAINVYDAVAPILGSKKAGKKVTKGAGGDISMTIDLIAEETIIKALQEANINILLISEELGEEYIGEEEKAKEEKGVLVIDPIDGSNNAVRGIPYCSVSIAYAIGNKMSDIKKAVVLNLNTKDMYWAERGKGAYLNDKLIHVSDLDLSQQCFFELNLPMRDLMKNIEKLAPLIKNFFRIRILGSSALTLCQIARGSMEAFINLRRTNRLVDVAAGMLILEEAGGKFFSKEGNRFEKTLSINTKFPFIASNSKLESFLKDTILKIYS